MNMNKNIVYPERPVKLHAKTEYLLDYNTGFFNDFYLNILYNPHVKVKDRLKLMKSFSQDIDWHISSSDNLNLLSLVLVNEFSPHQKRFDKELDSEIFDKDLDELCFYITSEMLKRNINPLNEFILDNKSYFNLDQIIFFGLVKTLSCINSSKFKPDNFNDYLLKNYFVYPYEQPLYRKKECESQLLAFFSLVENDMTELLDVFLSNGFDINFINDSGENALFYATSAKMTDYLIEKNISKTAYKNNKGKSAKEFVKERANDIKITDAEINKMINSMNLHFDIPEEEMIERIVMSFGNDSFTNFRKLVNNNPKLFRIKQDFLLTSEEDMTENALIKTKNIRTINVEKIDVIQTIMLCVWINKYKINVYEDKFYSKINILLKEMLSYEKDYLMQKGAFGIQNSSLLLTSIFMPFNESHYKNEQEKMKLKTKSIIKEKIGLHIPELQKVSNIENSPLSLEDRDYFVDFYKTLIVLLENLKTLSFNRFSFGNFRNIFQVQFTDSALLYPLAEKVYLYYIMKKTVNPHDMINQINLKKSDDNQFVYNFIDMWKNLVNNIINRNKKDFSQKNKNYGNASYIPEYVSEEEIKRWFTNNQSYIMNDALISSLIQYIPDSILYDKIFGHLLENIILKIRNKQNVLPERNKIKRI